MIENAHTSNQRRRYSADGLRVAFLLVLVVCASWLRGGTYPPLQPFLLLGGFLLLAGNSLAGYLDETHNRRLSTDLTFWAGFFLIAYLCVEWWNSGRTLFFDIYTYTWTYPPAPISWLPSAIKKVDVQEICSWFFPAWAILIAVRSLSRDRNLITHLYRLLMLNSFLLGLFGIIQFLDETTYMYWFHPIAGPFFASFGYTNHAGGFFSLSLALVGTALLLEVFYPTTRRSPLWISISSCAFLTIFISANLTFSRAAILLSWGLTGLFVIAFIICSFRRLTHKQRRIWIIAIISVMSITICLLLFVAGETLKNEVSTLIPSESTNNMNLTSGDRALFDMHTAAWNMFKDHMWYGTGAWGFRYFLSMYLPQEKWSLITTGKANLHNDPFQFLVEFGIIGTSLLFVTLFPSLCASIRSLRKQPLPIWYLLAGLSLIALYSLIDLPFRCPAILYVWTLLLASLPLYTSNMQNTE